MTATKIGLQDRIRSAYNVCSDYTPRTWVGLARLRTWLRDVPREEQDAALIMLSREPDVNIVPESNQKTLTVADREAALWMGNQWKHLISIG